MHDHILKLFRPPLWLVLVLGLVACQGQSVVAPTAVENVQEVVSTISAVPDPTETRLPLPVADTPTAVSESVPTISATPLEDGSKIEAEKDFDGISQGLTADGFPYLGDPDAPVTLIDYSDFL